MQLETLMIPEAAVRPEQGEVDAAFSEIVAQLEREVQDTFPGLSEPEIQEALVGTNPAQKRNHGGDDPGDKLKGM